MTETTPTPTPRNAAATREGPGAGASASAGSGTDLESSRGGTHIADSVLNKVAGLAAREVAGVHDLGGTGARALGSVTQRVGIDTKGQGVSVETEGTRASVEVTIVVEYGESIPDVAQEVRDQVIRRVEGLCGFGVSRVDVSVDDLHFAGDDEDREGERS